MLILILLVNVIGYYGTSEYFIQNAIFNAHACESDKAVASVLSLSLLPSTQESPDLDFLASGQHHHDVKNGKKVTSLSSKVLDKDHECYKLCFLVSHTYRPHAVSIAHT